MLSGNPTVPVKHLHFLLTPSRLLLLRLDVSCEAVEDRLPAALLLLDRVRRFAIEGNADDSGALAPTYDESHDRLIVGRPRSNLVTLLQSDAILPDVIFIGTFD